VDGDEDEGLLRLYGCASRILRCADIRAGLQSADFFFSFSSAAAAGGGPEPDQRSMEHWNEGSREGRAMRG
jgi:hypothetical protein